MNTYATGSPFSCENGDSLSGLQTPEWEVDLSDGADLQTIIDVIIPSGGYGECCGYANNFNSIVLELYLSPDAVGVNFTLTGASGNTYIHYGDCTSDPYSAGDPICVSGEGPHYFMFARTGTTDYSIGVESLPGPVAASDVVTADGCQDTLTVGGVIPESITWTSIPQFDENGNLVAEGYYNDFLNNLDGTAPGSQFTPYPGEETIIVTPGASYPETIYFEVCGDPLANSICPDNPLPQFCDTGSVSIYPTLFADILPDPVAVCAGGLAQTLTAYPIGGTAPYGWTWSTAVDGTINGATTQDVNVTLPGEYSVVITDATGCPAGYDTVVVTQYDDDISVNAGPDVTICGTPVPTINLQGSSPITGEAYWAGYSGSFSTSDTDTIAAYTPSQAELDAGIVNLELYSANNQACPGDTDYVTIYLPQFSGVIDITPTDITCNTLEDGSIDLNITGGAIPYLYDWNTDGTGDFDDVEDLSGLDTGTFDVVIQDDNGCIETTSAIINEPPPVVVTINGDALLCNGDADGNVTGTISGGTPPYLVTLDETGATFVVGTDGGAYNFSGLSAAISGGFDQYSVTVTDANGNTGGCLGVAGPVNMIEPLPIVVTINGDAILCNGAADGNVTGSISGGTAPYTITLDQTGTTLNVATDGGTYDFSGLSAAISGGFNSYTVSVMDANGNSGGCITTAGPVAMTEPIPLTVNIVGDALLCYGAADGNVTGSISGGTAPYTITLDQTGATQVVAASGGTYDFSGLSAAISGGFNQYSVTVTDANGNSGGCLEIAGPVDMIEPAPLVVTIAGDAILCLGDADGNVTGTISGGTAPYTIILDQTGDVLNIASDGGAYDFGGLSSSIDGGFDQYTVTVVDANGGVGGCTAAAGPVDMLEPSALTLDTTVSLYSGGYNVSGCANDGWIDLEVIGGVAPYTYDWNIDGMGDNDDTEDISLLPEGNYSVIVTDFNGCSNQLTVFLDAPDTVKITDATLSSYNGGVNISCNGGTDGSIDISATGGVPPYTYDWDNDGIWDYDDPEDLAGIPAGTYVLVITDQNGCTGDTTVTLIEPLPLVVTITGDDILCNGDADGNVSGIVTGGTAPYTVTLDQTGTTTNVIASGNTYDFSGLSAAISGGFDQYSVTVTDANGNSGGCLAIGGPVDMTEPLPLVVTINGDALLCNGDADGNVTGTISGGTAPYIVTLDETGTTLNVATDGGSYDFSGLSAAISGGFDQYNVTVTDANGFAGGCSANVGPVDMIEPLPLVVAINGDVLLCNGDADGNVTGTISGGTAPYIITLDETGATLNVATDGGSYDFSGLSAAISGGFDQYSVTVTDANGTTGGCTEVAGPVNMVEPAPLVVTINGDALLCNGDADGNVTGTISGGTAPYTITLDETGDIINVAFDGGTYDFSGLSAAISGGFDQYSVTVTDANGNTGGCLATAGPVNMIEPLPLVVTINGDALLCNGDADGNVTGTITGGTAPYTITLDETGATLNVAVDGGSYDFSGLSAAISGGFDQYSVSVTDANGNMGGCTSVAGPVNMIEPLPLVVTINGDALLCNGDADGNVTGTITGGTAPYIITLDETGATLNVAVDGGSYDFSGLSAAISGGFDQYSVTVTDANGTTGGCTEVAGPVNMVEPAPLVVTINGDALLCNGDADGNVTGTISGGTAPYTITLDETGATLNVATDGGSYDFSGLSAAISGGFDQYSVTVTDANGTTGGCTEVAGPVNMVEPAPLVVTINGDALLCNGDADGNVTGTISGGTAPYTIFLNQTGDILNVATDGGTYDFSGLSAAISGGFNQYSVTVFDANGSTGGCSELAGPVAMFEPSPLVVTINGDILLCNGDADGNVTGTISGGTAPYVVTLDETGATLNVATDGGTYDFSGLSTAISGGFDQYNVTVTDANGNTGGCTAMAGPVAMVEPLPIAITINGDDILCFGAGDGNVTGTISGGTAPYVVTLDQTGASLNVATDGGSYDFSGLDGLPSGGFDQYSVSVIDANGNSGGCSAIAGPVPMTEPEELIVTINGDAILCYGDGDGNVTGTITGGTAPYTITLDQTGATINVLTDGGSYDFSGLDGLPSGGFDQYTVSVVDANGSTGGCSTFTTPVMVTEPEELIVTINGDDILCYGDADGNVTGTITGGTAPYSVTLNETGAVLVVAADGGSYDFSGLSGLASGGFDTYTVTVNDANGSAGGCNVVTPAVPVTEPQPLTNTLTPSVYAGGFNISGCVDDGTLDLEVFGGVGPYVYDWNIDGTGDNDDTQDLNNLGEGTYNVTVTDFNGCILTDGIYMDAPDVIVIVSLSSPTYPSGDNISCFGFSDGSIELEATGGTGPYMFDWDNDGTGDNDDPEDLTNIPFGLYNLTITDQNGCTKDTLINLIQPTPFVQDYSLSSYNSGDNISCFGATDGSIDYTISGASPGYVYDWDLDGTGDNDDTQDLNNLGAGTYSVIVTDINGCQIDTTITLIEPEIIATTVDVVSDFNGYGISCSGSSDGELNVNVSGGSPNYNYVWLNEGGDTISVNANPNGLSAGTYDIIITDINGCEATNSVVISEPPPFDIFTDVVSDFNGNDVSCYGATDGQVNISISGGLPDYFYAWTNETTGVLVSTEQNPSNFGAGTYSVVITDQNNCQSDTVVTLTEPDLLEIETQITTDYNGQDISCYQAADGGVSGSASGGTPNYDYQWTDPFGNVVGSTTNVNNLDIGTYTLTVTDANGCIAVDGITVTQPPLIQTGITVLSDYNGLPISCSGQDDGEIEANPNGGTPGYTYAWNTIPVQTTQNATDLGEGTYTVVVTDLNGCQATNTISIQGNPLPMINPGPPQSICLGEMAVIQSFSNPDDECEWFFSNNAYLNDCGPIEMFFQDTGCYNATLVVTGPLGCVDSVQLFDYVCVNPLPEASFEVDEVYLTTIQNVANFTNTSTGATDYIWYMGDGHTSTLENPFHYYPTHDDGDYTTYLYAYTEFGCVDSAYVIIHVEDELYLFVPNTFTPDGDDYNEVFLPIINGDFNPEDYTLYIFNRWGELVFESHNHLVGWNGTYGEGYNFICQDGTYTWKIIVGDEESAEKSEFVGHVNLLK